MTAHRLAPNPRLLPDRRRGHCPARRVHVPRLRGRPAAAAALFGPLERLVYRLCGVDPKREQTWVEYTVSLLVFSAVRRAGHLRHPAAAADLCRSIRSNSARWSRPWPSTPPAASPPTPTGSRTAARPTMSYLTQMAGLAWHNFTSAAAGIAVALAVARGLTRRRGPDGAEDARQLLGRSHPRDRSTCCCRSRIVFALVLVSQGVIQNFSAYRDVTTLEGVQADPGARARSPRRRRSRCSAPTAAASSTPTAPIRSRTRRRSRTSSQMFSIFAIPAALTYTFGRWPATGGRAGRCSPRWRSSSSPASTTCYWAEAHANPALARPGGCTRRRQHGGQGDALRRRRLGAVRHRHHRRLLRRGQRHARQLHAARGPGAAGQHPARRGDLRRRRRRPLRHPGLRAPRRLHRRPDGRPHARVPRQEDRGRAR